ncbi:MAG: DUF222 domain-containing protein [Propionibacteriales bacterium]|nr:DUF222 domain-containing protein [Propionibacteriales bacterium]
MRACVGGCSVEHMIEAGDDAALVDALGAARRQACICEARQLALIYQLYRRRRSEDPDDRQVVGARSQTLTELQPVLGQSRSRLGSRLRLAEALQTRLPRTWGLLAAGRIDEYTASVIVSELDKLADPDLIPVVERKLVDRLVPDTSGDPVVMVPPTQVGRWARALVAQVEPDQQEERFKKGFADRGVDVFGSGDGLADLVLHHSGAELEALSHRLSLIARQTGADDPRSMNQRRADVAVDLLLPPGDGRPGAVGWSGRAGQRDGAGADPDRCVRPSRTTTQRGTDTGVAGAPDRRRPVLDLVSDTDRPGREPAGPVHPVL